MASGSQNMTSFKSQEIAMMKTGLPVTEDFAIINTTKYTVAQLAETNSLAIVNTPIEGRPHDNHGLYLSIKDIGTPFQIMIGDSSMHYIYKRYKDSTNGWQAWFKLSAGHADDASIWTTTRTFTIGATGKSVNGSANVSWTKAEIIGSGTTAQFLRGDHTWTNTLLGPLRIGTTDAAATTGYATADVGSQNYIAFYGVYGDGAGSYNHTYIGESIYGSKTTANEQSELLLFHGNDPGTSSGPDRIRLFAGQIDIQVYTAATSGTWDAIRATSGTQVANFSSGGLTFPNSDVGITQTLTDTSNWGLALKWNKKTAYTKTYKPGIGFHNTGASISIVPYETDTAPWNGTVGLFVSASTIQWENHPLVTTDTAQTISGVKTHTGNLNIGASAAGGLLNGSATNGGCNSIKIGDDVWLGDINQGGILGMQAVASSTTVCGFYCRNGAGTDIGHLYFDGTYLQCNKSFYDSSEIISSSANGFRLSYGSYGIILRNDGSDFYILLTASGSSLTGSWNSLRPFRIQESTGNVYMSHAVSIGTTLSVGTDATVSGTINSWKLAAVSSLNANDVRTSNGLWAVANSITNAAHTNHSLLLGVSNVGTPFQLQIPDSSVMYIYKRYYSSGAWSGWTKIYAGYADSAGRINGNLGQATSNVDRNIWVSSTNSADGIPNYVTGFYINPSTQNLVTPGDMIVGGTGNRSTYLTVMGDWSNNSYLWLSEGSNSTVYGGYFAYGASDLVHIGTRNNGGDVDAITISRGSTDVTIKGNTTSNGFTLPSSSYSLIQKLANSSNWGLVCGWNTASGYSGYLPGVGFHNTGSSISIVPYATSTSPWGGTVGLFVSSSTIKWENHPLATTDTAQTFTGNKSWGTSGQGGYLNGAATNGGINSILIGDDVWLGDCNQSGIMGMKSSATNCGFWFYNSSGTNTGKLYYNGTFLYTSNRFQVGVGTDVTTSNTSGAFIVGDPSGENIGIDGNEIMARNSSGAATIYINSEGGDLYFGTSSAIHFTGGHIYASAVHNAVWNDFAEYRQVSINDPGRVVIPDTDGYAKPSTARLQAGARVISDTYGCTVGKSDTAKTPLGMAGRVLAYPYRPINEYHIGNCVCSAPNGTVDIMTREEIKEYPDRIIGIVNEIPNYSEWRQTLTSYDDCRKKNNINEQVIQVKGRIWIDIK